MSGEKAAVPEEGAPFEQTLGASKSADNKLAPNSTNGQSDEDEVRYTGPEDDNLHHIARTLSRQSSLGSFDGTNPIESSDPELDPNSPEFNVRKWLKVVYNILHSDPERYQDVSLGVAFKELHAYGQAADVNYQVTVGNTPLFAAQKFWAFLKEKLAHQEGSTVDILKPMDGIVKPGELLMVLGRPGAGCSTFLRTMAAQTFGFKVSNDSIINYQGVKPDEIANHYRSSVTYCAETETHYPQLTVGQTLMFAARLSTPHNRFPGVSRQEFAQYSRDIVMTQYGLSHTVNTRVGSDLIRGVSGGERKRVSIAELALAGASIQCWDNSTRGLDSATANEFIQTLKGGAETFGSTPLVAVYQASEEMYEMFTRVIVLYEGYQIYFGPIGKARQFFIDQGWRPKPRQSTPDFLTSLSQPTERECFPGKEKEVPRTAEEFNQRWKNSQIYAELRQEIDEYLQENPFGSEPSDKFRNAYQLRKAPNMPKKSVFRASWGEQTMVLTKRGFDRLKGDPQMPLTTILGNFGMAWIIGSMFYRIPEDAGSFYSRGALLFFALLFNAFSALLEIFSLYESRAIVQKQHMYAFYHPAIEALSSILTEMPVKIATAILFNVVIYWLPGLRDAAGNFFFFLLMNFVSTLMMSHFFRTIGACTNSIAEAMIPGNAFLLAMVFFTGFVIPKPKLFDGWTVGGPYINPLAYSFEALMTNEFHDRHFDCPSNSFVPYPPSQAVGNSFICGSGGGRPGETFIDGDYYLSVQYDYSFSHQWRNFGIEMGFVAFFLFTYMLAVYLNPGERTKGEVLVFGRSVVRKMMKEQKKHDAEHGGEKSGYSQADALDDGTGDHDEEADNLIEASNDVFYWKDVCYDIKIKNEPRRLLNYVDGWVKPGTLTALMGASGAGKTTLLDTLANRVTMGVVTGQMFVNGIPRDDSFQRTTGYAMQQDLHMETSTVREALVFSALLRQPNSTPRQEKLAYVDNVIKILEMEAYADAVVGVPGKGLNVEQRKRLTIGVELAAKPKLLLFLDEPTSGLDSQTAWSVCQLMKKLSGAGQAILCTIHQPSALLLSQFDRLLFLARGGRTVYFGDIGDNCSVLTSYFEKYGADPCPPDANPAEWMLSVIGAAPGSHAKYDYADVWLHSSERLAVRGELDRLLEHYDAKETNEAEKTPDSGEYAAPYLTQYLIACHRNFQQFWRDPMYIWPKIFINVVSAILNGFVFFKSDTSIQGMQDLMFSVFMFSACINPMINAFVDVFKKQRDLFEARERPSKIFSWQAFLGASMTAEMPWQILVAIFSFVSWYYPAGLYADAQYEDQMHHRGGMTLFYCMLYFVWVITLGFLIGAPLDDARTGANISVLLYTTSLMFSGVLVTRAAMPGFWQFMYRVSPLTYWIHGMLALGVANAPVKCADNEWLVFDPPSGSTCQQYFQKMFDAAPEAAGTLQNPDSTSSCQYCRLSSTNQYLASIESEYSTRWPNFGYFWAFIGFNVIGCIFLYWLARVPKSKSRVAKVDYGGRDPALEEAPESDTSKWPEALKSAQGKPYQEVLGEDSNNEQKFVDAKN